MMSQRVREEIRAMGMENSQTDDRDGKRKNVQFIVELAIGILIMTSALFFL